MKKAASVTPVKKPPLEAGPATVQLDGYYIRELHCAVRPGFDEEAKFTLGTGLHLQQSEVMLCPPITTNLKVETGRHTKDPLRFRVVLQIESKEESETTPYIFDVHLVGFFSVSDVKPFTGLDVWVYRNAVMILYSTAREVIASTTGRGPFPAIILPTLTFDLTETAKAALLAEAEAELKKVAQKNQAPALPPAPAKKPSSKKPRKKGTKK